MSKQNPSTGRMRRWQLFLVDATLTLAGILSIAGGLHSIYRDNATLAATCMAAGLILLFAATLQRFELLKGFGVEAKMNKLDDTIDKAEVALKKLREVGEITSKSIISLSSAAGRTGGAPSLQKASKLAADIRLTLEGLESSEDVIRSTLAPWIKIEADDLARAAIHQLRLALDTKAQQLQTFGTVEPTNILALSDRVNALRGHTHSYSDNVARIQPELLPALVNECIEKAPELSVGEKAEFAEQLRAHNEEISYLVAHYSFRNFQFWLENLPDRNDARHRN